MVVGGCIWIITSALVLFLSFEIEIGDGPGPELDNILISSTRLTASRLALLIIAEGLIKHIPHES